MEVTNGHDNKFSASSMASGSRVDEIQLRSNSMTNEEKALKGHAVQIVEIDSEDHSFRLDEEALDEIITNDRVKDLPICVVSVAGMFLLNGGNLKIAICR